jgi:hypothetical protein
MVITVSVVSIDSIDKPAKSGRAGMGMVLIGLAMVSTYHNLRDSASVSGIWTCCPTSFTEVEEEPFTAVT